MKKIIIILMMLVLLASVSYSNGGCIKIAGDVLVQMSHAPHVPKVNEQVSFLFSFGNKTGLVREEIIGKIKIVQNDRIWLENDFTAKDGILGLKHQFKNPGLYEIFLEFEIDNKKYAPEDFLIEVISQKNDFFGKTIFLLIGVAIGFVLALFVRLRRK